MVQVKLGKVLGEGTFGTTYMGRWRGGDVAVKCVRIQQRNEAESFLREVHVLACVRHPNVMPFYGRHVLDTILPFVLAEHTALVLQVQSTCKSCAASSQPVTRKLTELNLRCMQSKCSK
jgi:serine/threonine protein kinase